jgi:hypothetical protein
METTESIRVMLGTPSPYRDSKHSIIVGGLTSDDRPVEATVTLTLHGGHLKIENLRALQPGGGSMLMRKICALADSLQLGISLEAKPYPAKPGVRRLNKRQLVEFYRAFGFTVVYAGTSMYRIPSE